MNFEELLAPGGHMREFMRGAPGGGEWVDAVCNNLLLELTSTHLENLTLQFGAKRANVALLSDGRVQLNVAWDTLGAWSCYTADTFAAAMDQMWNTINMVNQIKENTNVV